MTNSHAKQMLSVNKVIEACPCCDYWWAKQMVVQDNCKRCGGTGLDEAVPPGDMIK
jgi:hypothetical protein